MQLKFDNSIMPRENYLSGMSIRNVANLGGWREGANSKESTLIFHRGKRVVNYNEILSDKERSGKFSVVTCKLTCFQESQRA